MVGYAFDYRDPSKDFRGNNSVSSLHYYSVGNPMGFLSSWASFTLTHHLVMYICCLRAKIDFNTSRYMLLGDDIIIYDNALAVEYQILIKSLGVEISEVKTHRSTIFFEFAKRYFYQGTEISPCSTKGFIEQSKSISSLIEFSNQLRDRGWEPLESFRRSVILFYLTKQG